jgi:hypothetical protein
MAADADSLSKPNSRWEELDAALSFAVLDIARGEAKREILMYQEKALRRGEPLGGRTAMFILLQRYHIDSGTQMQVDLSSIMALKFDGDLEIFLDKLDYVLLEANTSIPEEFLYAIIEPELRKSEDLAPDFVVLDATEDNDPRRTSGSLYVVARRCVARMQRMSMRASLTSKGDPSKALVASAKPVHGTEGKGGKQDRSNAEKSLLPCFKFAAGTCQHGDNCLYSHTAPPVPPKWVATEKKKCPMQVLEFIRGEMQLRRFMYL